MRTRPPSSSCTPRSGSAFLLASTIALGFIHQADDRRAHLRLPRARGVERTVGHHRGAAVPRIHGRVRHQGAAVPVPHLAAARAHRSADRGLGGAGRRHPEDGRLRAPAVLVRAVPTGVGRPRADLPHARGDRDHLRGDRRRDADRPQTRSSRTRRSRTWASSCSASSRSPSSASTERCSRCSAIRSPPARSSS